MKAKPRSNEVMRILTMTNGKSWCLKEWNKNNDNNNSNKIRTDEEKEEAPTRERKFLY